MTTMTDHVHTFYVWRMRGKKVRCRCEDCGHRTGWIPNYVNARDKPLYDRELLRSMSRDELMGLVRQNGGSGLSKATKAQLVEYLSELVAT